MLEFENSKRISVGLRRRINAVRLLLWYVHFFRYVHRGRQVVHKVAKHDEGVGEVRG